MGALRLVTRGSEDAIARLASQRAKRAIVGIVPVCALPSPLLTVVRLPLFACPTARRKGPDLDVMRGDQPAHARARAALSL